MRIFLKSANIAILIYYLNISLREISLKMDFKNPYKLSRNLIKLYLKNYEKILNVID